MTVKDRVFDILTERSGSYVSGQYISECLGCSRMAVSKSVRALQEEGYRIDAVRKLGYMLTDSDVLSEKTLSQAMDIPVRFFEETTSTFVEARHLIAEGVKAPFAVVAMHQTGGRGRLGRSFFSPDGGLYICLTLGAGEMRDPDLLTIRAAVAVAQAIEALSGRECQIKWVNDIYMKGRKIVGILTEGIVNMELGGLDLAIVGIGVNISGKSSDIPSELRDKMGFIYQDEPALFTRAALAGEIARRLLGDSEGFIGEYRKRCFILGKEILTIKAGEEREAVAEAIDDQGHLLVRYSDGSEDVLSSGEVTLRIHPF